MSAALDLLGTLRLEDGIRWGDRAVDWQRADAAAVLDPAPGAPRLHYLTRPRGGSMTSDTAGMVIAALLEDLPEAARVVWVAADRDRGRLGVDAMAGLVRRTPGLRSVLKVDQWRITAPNGATVEVLAADGPSAFGLRPHMIVVDEHAVWPNTGNARQVWEALVSAVPKVPGCRMVVMTSAGDPSSHAARTLERAKRSRAWRVNEVPGPLPWMPADVLDEQRSLLTDSQFARLHLNTWCAPEDRLTTRADVLACVAHEGPLLPERGRSYIITLDAGLVNDRTVAVIAHADGRGEDARSVIDRVSVWQGSKASQVRLAEVEAWLRHASHEFNRAPILMDPWQTAGTAQRLPGQGLSVSEFVFTAQSTSRLATALYRALRDHRLALPDDDELIDELSNARLVEKGPGQVRIDHDAGSHDDRVIAVAMVVLHFGVRPERSYDFLPVGVPNHDPFIDSSGMAAWDIGGHVDRWANDPDPGSVTSVGRRDYGRGHGPWVF